MYAYFIDISQGSIETHLRCGGIYKVTLSQIVCRVCQWKNFENQSIIGEDMDNSKVAHFFGPPCTYVNPVLGYYYASLRVYIVLWFISFLL